MLERHEKGEIRVIPIILRPVYWHGEPIGRLQALPTDGKPVTGLDWHDLDTAFYNIADGIYKVVKQLTAQPAAAFSRVSEVARQEQAAKVRSNATPDQQAANARSNAASGQQANKDAPLVRWYSPHQHATIHLAMALTHLLTCPICSLPLSVVGNTFSCPKAHTFDIAREGYVNLLRKKLPGDTKEMLVARRQFLEQGYYQPLSDQLNELIYAHLPTSAPKVLDAGCGEGYYLERLQQFLAQKQPAIQGEYVGIDISKEAIRLAAKHYRECCFAVANLKERFVFADGTLDILLNIFAPHNVEEFARVLTPGGLLMLVIPGPTHLLQLRQKLHLLNIEEQKQQRVMEQFAPSFKLLTTSTLHYTLHLDNTALRQLVMMTPNFWHLSSEVRQAMLSIDKLQTQVEFICMLWLLE